MKLIERVKLQSLSLTVILNRFHKNQTILMIELENVVDSKLSKKDRPIK